MPVIPLGKKPPCCHKLLNPIGCQLLVNPNKITEPPRAIIATIATTLISANQNSNSPKTFTAMRLIKPIANMEESAQIHCGVSGNQMPM